MKKPRLTPVVVRYMAPTPAIFWCVSGELVSPDGHTHAVRSNLRHTPELAWRSYQAILDHYSAFWSAKA